MTLILSEEQVTQLLDMKEVVNAVERAFREQALGNAINSPRTRTVVPGSILNVMHASSPYLGRAGLKCYLSSKAGTKFIFILFDNGSGAPLAVMGADVLGRYRTGAASAVATRHLFRGRTVRLAIFGSGKQAMTQVTAIGTVADIARVKVWSRDPAHARRFSEQLRSLGIECESSETPEAAGRQCDVGSAITSAKSPFLGIKELEDMQHLNLCGSNSPFRAEALPEAVAGFETLVVDDLLQAKAEAGDLIQAAQSGKIQWDRVVEMKEIVSHRAKPEGRSLFKSAGVAIEDVAVGSMIYDRALKSGEPSTSNLELV